MSTINTPKQTNTTLQKHNNKEDHYLHSPSSKSINSNRSNNSSRSPPKRKQHNVNQQQQYQQQQPNFGNSPPGSPSKKKRFKDNGNSFSSNNSNKTLYQPRQSPQKNKNPFNQQQGNHPRNSNNNSNIIHNTTPSRTNNDKQNQQNSQETNSTHASTITTKPDEAYILIDKSQVNTANTRNVIHQVVKNHLFPNVSQSINILFKQFYLTLFSLQVKFINNKHKKLVYYHFTENPKAYSAIVLKHCNLPSDINKEQWWYSCAKSIVVQKISQLRNAVLKSIRMQWIGKLHL